jgi:hypothetical protein
MVVDFLVSCVGQVVATIMATTMIMLMNISI